MLGDERLVVGLDDRELVPTPSGSSNARLSVGARTTLVLGASRSSQKSSAASEPTRQTIVCDHPRARPAARARPGTRRR